MRAIVPTSAVYCVLALLASGDAPAGLRLVQPVATVASETASAPLALAAFDRFELADAVLDARLPRDEGNERARRELRMHLRDRLGPWLAARNAQPARGQRRTLRIEPTIVATRVVDPGVRLAVGPWVGSEQLHVRVRFVDAAKGEAIGEILLRADGSGLTPVSSLDAAAPALPRRIADALADVLDAAVVSL